MRLIPTSRPSMLEVGRVGVGSVGSGAGGVWWLDMDVR
jgi:hypothetical protein